MANNIPTAEFMINKLRSRYNSGGSRSLDFRSLYGTELEQAINCEVQEISKEIVGFSEPENQFRLKLFMSEIELMISVKDKPEISSLAQQIIESIYLKVRLRSDGKGIGSSLTKSMGTSTLDFWKNVRRSGYLDGAIPKERSTKTTVRLKSKQLTEAIKLYKEVGLFKGQPIKEVLKDYRLELAYSEDFYAESPPKLKWQIVELTRLSKSFALWGDPECDVCIDNQKYLEFLMELSCIADGYFSPEKIDERWESDEGPIIVSFQNEDKVCTFRPRYNRDYLDLNVAISVINSAIIADRKFEVFSDANLFVILFITSEQKQRLIDELEFPFNK